MHIPLAWFNLIHNKRRLLVSLSGITFAVLLLFMQLGFWNALLDASGTLIQRFNGDLVIASKARYSMNIRELFTIRRLAEARAVPGVKAAFPVYIESAYSLWRNTENRDDDSASVRPIRVVAFDPDQNVLNIPAVQAGLSLLKTPGSVLADSRSRDKYGDLRKGVCRELADRSVRVVGNFDLGVDFSNDGNLVMSDQTFAELFADRLGGRETLHLPSLGLVQVEPGANVEAVRDALDAALPDDVAVYTLAEFEQMEKDFWRTSTPIGTIFFFGLAVGGLVGMVICSQILISDVTDHLREYATLKAIGYREHYLTLIVLQQGLLLALLSFVPALLISLVLYEVLSSVTQLPLYLTVGRALTVLALTAGMCMASGLLAVRKAQYADPAELF